MVFCGAGQVGGYWVVVVARLLAEGEVRGCESGKRSGGCRQREDALIHEVSLSPEGGRRFGAVYPGRVRPEQQVLTEGISHTPSRQQDAERGRQVSRVCMPGTRVSCALIGRLGHD